MGEDEIRDKLRALVPVAQRRLLETQIGWTNSQIEADPSGAIRAAIQSLPGGGKIKGQKKQAAVAALPAILAAVPEDSPDRDALAIAVRGLLARL